MASKKRASADDEIAAMFEADEAGVADAMKAYELVEKRYFDAVSATTFAPTFSPTTTTTPGPAVAGANTLSA